MIGLQLLRGLIHEPLQQDQEKLGLTQQTE